MEADLLTKLEFKGGGYAARPEFLTCSFWAPPDASPTRAIRCLVRRKGKNGLVLIAPWRPELSAGVFEQLPRYAHRQHLYQVVGGCANSGTTPVEIGTGIN